MLNHSPQSLRSSLIPSLIALLCIIAVGGLQIPQLNQLKDKSTTASPTELQRQIEAEKVRLNLLQKMPTFGFDNLLADWVFLNFLQNSLFVVCGCFKNGMQGYHQRDFQPV